MTVTEIKPIIKFGGFLARRHLGDIHILIPQNAYLRKGEPWCIGIFIYPNKTMERVNICVKNDWREATEAEIKSIV